MVREFSGAEKKMMKWLGRVYDIIVLSVGILAVVYVLYLIFILAVQVFTGFNVEEVLQEIVTILIFLEIFEILSMYFLHHHVHMRNVVEIGVLALVKELLVNINIEAMPWETLLAIAAVIFVLGILYVLEMKRINAHEEFLVKHGIKKEE